MKKIFAAIMMAAMFAVMIPALSVTTSAQTRYYPSNRQTYVYGRPSFYRRHRNLINVAIGTGAGAVVGGVVGGKKWAGIGALIGAGGAALYTFKIRPKRQVYYPGY